jgi:hypothetical protein
MNRRIAHELKRRVDEKRGREEGKEVEKEWKKGKD